MSIERLHHLKEILLCAIEGEIDNLYEVDYNEMGAAIDMIKDLEEAIYYKTITEAMHADNKKNGHQVNDGHVYYSISEEEKWEIPRDIKEGRSHVSRKMYMEAKEMKKDKTTQLRELEKYMQELTSDIIEMIQDASPEERQYLEKKISALASKIGQMR